MLVQQSMPPAMQGNSQMQSMPAQSMQSMPAQSMQSYQAQSMQSLPAQSMQSYQAQSLQPASVQQGFQGLTVKSQQKADFKQRLKESRPAWANDVDEGPSWHSEVEGFLWGVKEDRHGNTIVGGEKYKFNKEDTQRPKRDTTMRDVKLEIDKLRKENERFRLAHPRHGCLQHGALDPEECMVELQSQLADTEWEADRRVEGIRGHVKSLQKENDRLREQIPGFEARLQQLRPVISSLEREVNSTMSMLSNKDRELKSLEAQAKSLGKEIADAERRRKGCEDQKYAVNEELEAIQRETEILQIEAANLEQEVELQERGEPSINELRATEEIQRQRSRHEVLKAELDGLKATQMMWPAAPAS